MGSSKRIDEIYANHPLLAKLAKQAQEKLQLKSASETVAAAVNVKASPVLDVENKVGRSRDQKKRMPSAPSQVVVPSSAFSEQDLDIWSTDNVGYMARALVQACLPIREPKGAPLGWGRRSGDTVLYLQPGLVADTSVTDGMPKMVSLGYPFGALPRLYLAWLTTEVKRTKSREIYLGGSQLEFMRSLGITGKAGTDYRRLKEQLTRLWAARISISSHTKDEVTGAVTDVKHHLSIVDSSTAFWVPSDGSQVAGFESTIRLSELFYNEIVDHPVPINMQTLRELSSSAMAMDVYIWLTYRLYSVRSPTKIYWEHLMAQFGSEVKDMSKFRQSFKMALSQVFAAGYSPKLDVQTSCITLFPSALSVPRKKT